METLIKRSFFVLAATTLSMTTLRAQTADDIVNKYIDAIGGKAAIGNLHSVILTGTTSVMGNDMDTQDTIVYGKGYKNTSNFNGTPFVTCITPNGGWTINQYTNGTDAPTALPADQLKNQQVNLTLDPLAGYAANGSKIELAGQDADDYKLKVSGSGTDATYFINTKTYLVDKVVSHVSMNGQEGDVTITFSDYRKLPDVGVMYPYGENLEIPQGGQTLTLARTVKSVTVNPTVDPSIFEMPKH